MGIQLFQGIVKMHVQGSAAPAAKFAPDVADDFVHDLEKLCTSGAGSDFSLLINNTPVAVHRCILASRNEALKSLFLEHAKRDSAPYVEQGLNADAFKAYLRYAYYGATDISPKDAARLLNFAKKNHLKGLETLTESVVGDNITNENALNTLLLTYAPPADEKSKQMRRTCLEYICANLSNIDISPLEKQSTDVVSLDILTALQESMKSGPRPAHQHQQQPPAPPKVKPAAPAPLPSSSESEESTPAEDSQTSWSGPAAPKRPAPIQGFRLGGGRDSGGRDTSAPPPLAAPPQIPSQPPPPPPDEEDEESVPPPPDAEDEEGSFHSSDLEMD